VGLGGFDGQEGCSGRTAEVGSEGFEGQEGLRDG